MGGLRGYAYHLGNAMKNRKNMVNGYPFFGDMAHAFGMGSVSMRVYMQVFAIAGTTLCYRSYKTSNGKRFKTRGRNMKCIHTLFSLYGWYGKVNGLGEIGSG